MAKMSDDVGLLSGTDDGAGAAEPDDLSLEQPFRTREDAERFIRQDLTLLRSDYLRDKAKLNETQALIEGEIARSEGKSRTALLETLTSIISAKKTLTTSYQTFCLQITKHLDLLSELNKPKDDGGEIMIIIGSWGDVPVGDVTLPRMEHPEDTGE